METQKYYSKEMEPRISGMLNRLLKTNKEWALDNNSNICFELKVSLI